MSFTAADILAIDDIPFEDVVVPEWKGITVRVMGLDAEEATKFSKSLVEMDGKGGVKSVNIDTFMPDLLALTLCNEQGERIFKTPEEIKALGKKSSLVLKRLSAKATELSGMNEESVKAAAKN